MCTITNTWSGVGHPDKAKHARPASKWKKMPPSVRMDWWIGNKREWFFVRIQKIHFTTNTSMKEQDIMSCISVPLHFSDEQITPSLGKPSVIWPVTSCIEALDDCRILRSGWTALELEGRCELSTCRKETEGKSTRNNYLSESCMSKLS